MSLRNHLPRHRPRHVCADPIQELPYRHLPSHNANSDVRALNPVSQLDVPDTRGNSQREVDRLRNLWVFEGKKRCHIDSVPGLTQNRFILAFDENDMISFAAWTVVPLKWNLVKCTLLPADIDESLIFALLGRYHVNGKKNWAPYEQAGFFYRRFHKHSVVRDSTDQH